MTTGTRQPGEFCWSNMITPQSAQARAFFASLLGWTYTEIPGLGHEVRVGGRGVGAIFDLDGPNTPPGTRPHIGVMVKVESADATVARVASLGGTARPAFDIATQGRMAVCTDPNGAGFDVWEPKNFAGTDGDSHLHGAPTWHETLTTDVDRAAAFYTALFGWTAQQVPIPGHVYTTFTRHGTPIAGAMRITPEMGVTRPHWGTYFAVDDADHSARIAVELGAALDVPVRDIPDVGRFCGITSPQGVPFYVITYAR